MLETLEHLVGLIPLAPELANLGSQMLDLG